MILVFSVSRSPGGVNSAYEDLVLKPERCRLEVAAEDVAVVVHRVDNQLVDQRCSRVFSLGDTVVQNQSETERRRSNALVESKGALEMEPRALDDGAHHSHWKWTGHAHDVRHRSGARKPHVESARVRQWSL